MHAPNPQGQIIEKGAQHYENMLPHHYLIFGMASTGKFELMHFEQDLNVTCGSRQASLSPKCLNNVPCSHDGWPHCCNIVFRKVDETKHNVFTLQ